MVKHRLIREEPPLSDDAVLVRALFNTDPHGGVFNRHVLISDVTYNFNLFGYYGLSLWLVSGAWPLERVLREKTRRARRVALFSAGELRAVGLGLAPSGRAPHYDTTHGPVYGGTYGSVGVTAGSAQELVDRLQPTAYTVEDNPFYEQDSS